jgi:hypothetical protein
VAKPPNENREKFELVFTATVTDVKKPPFDKLKQAIIGGF